MQQEGNTYTLTSSLRTQYQVFPCANRLLLGLSHTSPPLFRFRYRTVHPDLLHTVYYPLVFIPTRFTSCITCLYSSRLASHCVLPARIHPDLLHTVYYLLVFIQHKAGYLQAKHQSDSTVRLERRTEYQIKHTNRQHMIPTIRAMFTRTVITICFHPFLICIIAKRMHLEQH